MKSVRMEDGSLWTCEYKEELDKYRITVDTGQHKYEFDFNYSDLDYMLGEFINEMNDE